jgi:hypothetical protein
LKTPRALGGNARVRQDDNLNVPGLAIPLTFQPDVLINKSWKMLNGVQNRLNLQWHRWSWVRGFAFFSQFTN